MEASQQRGLGANDNNTQSILKMGTENKPKAIDLGLTVGLCSLLIGATYYCRNILMEMPGTNEGLGLSGLPWIIATAYFAAMSFTSFLALVGRSVTTIIGKENEYWSTLSSTMFRFLIYVLIHWFALWGIPFVLLMGVFMLIYPSLGEWLAFLICLISLIPISSLIHKIIPSDALQPIYRVNLSQDIGRLRAMLIVAGCFLIGYMVVKQSYTYEIGEYKTMYSQSGTLELKAIMKGTINNKDMVCAELFGTSEEATPIDTLRFVKYNEGGFIVWRDLDDLKPGIYGVRIFFSNYSSSNLLEKIYLRMLANNHIEDRFLFRLTANSNSQVQAGKYMSTEESENNNSVVADSTASE